ncbi:MAG TPA: sigma-70 family RNA polymerase sigma factor [Thermoanaerobaculia bacterium]|jgi:RNA polymerase sigma-70 factor (ECF subfamily)|nr:sigma-70 family RNA polymerase sigma factor [Thermoanaerobaculia bacterium]
MKNSWIGGETTSQPAEAAPDNLAVAVHRCEAGAFERLIDRFEQPLFTYAHGILQNAFDAQEVVQDAMMRAHRALTRQYDEARCAALALRPWLFRTVRNLSLNKRRSKRGSLEQPLDTYDDGRLGPFVSAQGSDLEKKEEVELLRRAMSLLPCDARELIVLRFMEEMPYAEIARTVGTSEAALRGKVFRSLKMLRDALEQKGVAYAM